MKFLRSLSLIFLITLKRAVDTRLREEKGRRERIMRQKRETVTKEQETIHSLRTKITHLFS